MRLKNVSILVALVVLGALGSTGCIGKSKYQQHVEQEDARVNSVESAVEANERRIADLGEETDGKIAAVSGEARSAQQTGDRAMSAAGDAKTAAERAERGKLLWSLKLTDGSVKFDLGKSEMSGDAKTALDDLIRKVKSYNRALYLEIEGHTDSTGGEEFNHELGLSRADAVRDYLHATGGIPLHAMNTISFGEANPEADNSTREGRAQNRRVVVNVLE